MIAHADNLGRLRGDPGYVRATVIPNEPGITDRRVEAWLDEMAQNGLLEWYQVDGARYLSLSGWAKNQDLKRIGGCRSEYPDPSLTDSVRVCQNLPRARAEVEVEVEVEVEGEVEVEEHRALTGSQPPVTEPVIELPTNRKGQTLAISEDAVSRWMESFPAVDVRQELRNMRSWLEANPTRRKTEGGMPAFIVRWLTKEQDRYHAGVAGGGGGRDRGMSAEDILRMAERMAAKEKTDGPI
jgi:hypothetical protein